MPEINMRGLVNKITDPNKKNGINDGWPDKVVGSITR